VKKLHTSLAFRLMCLYMVLFTLLAFALLGVHYWTTIHAPYQNIKKRVTAEAADLATMHDTRGVAALQDALQTRLAAGGARRPYHALIAADGKVITTNLPEWPEHSTKHWVRLSEYVHEDGETQDFEPLLRDHVFADRTRLLVGRDIEDIDELEEKLLSVALGVFVTGAALGLLGGWLLSRTIARRIGDVTRIASQVMEGDLSGRIAIAGQSDDFDRLNAVLNEMLARIENLVESVRRVSDNVAHELRTPLARLRTTLEPLRSSNQQISPLQIEDLLADVAALERTFDAVLRIARIENARQDLETAPLNLATMIHDAAELYGPAADDRALQLKVSVPQSLPVCGDRDLLFQALCNLIDNAIKYTPHGGKVSVAARLEDGAVEVSVCDTGPGIPAAHLPHVTERFYRVPDTAAEPGTGLGLSLVAAVAARHQSRLLFEEGSPGLVVRWFFPRAG
jgi:signal transduction histidine kinase